MIKLQLQNAKQTFTKGFLAILAAGFTVTVLVVMFSDHIKNDVRTTIICTLFATGIWTLRRKDEHAAVTSRIIVVILCALIAEIVLLQIV